MNPKSTDTSYGITPSASAPKRRWRFRLLLLTSIVTLLALGLCANTSAQLTTPRPADEITLPVAEWGGINRLEFKGINTFTTNSITTGLLQSPDFLLASHPAAPLREYAPAVARLVSAGYRSAGFRDVQVQAGLDETRKIVKVEIREGKRFRAGKIRFENPGLLPAPKLIKQLTTPTAPEKSEKKEESSNLIKNDSAAWAVGEPVGFDKNTAERIENSVREALGRAGYLFCTFKIRFEEEAGTNLVSLVVVIEQTGLPAKLGAIEVVGLSKHTPAELLDWLNLKSGQPLTIDLFPDLQQRMKSSGRFLASEFTPDQIPDKDGALALKIRVKEYLEAPKLNERLSSVQASLLRVQAWIEKNFAQGMEFQIEGVFKAYKLGNLKGEISGQLDMFFRHDAMAWLWQQDGKLVRGLLVNTNGIHYISTVTGRKLTYASVGALTIQAEFSVVPNPEAEGDASPFSTNFKFGFLSMTNASRSPVQIDFHIAPGVMFYELNKATTPIKTNKDELVLSTPSRSWRIQPSTGALIEALNNETDAKEKDGSSTYRLLPAPGSIARIETQLKAAGALLADAMHTNQPIASLAALIVGEYLEAPLAKQVLADLPLAEHLPAASRSLQRFILNGILNPLEPQVAAEKDGLETFFNIPDEKDTSSIPNAMQKLWSYAAAYTYRFSYEYLPPKSWPATLAREIVMLLAGHPKYAEPELNRIAESQDTGPIGCLIASHVLAFAGYSDGAAKFALIGTTRLDQEHFERDMALVLEITDRILTKSNQKQPSIVTLSPEELKAMEAVLPSSVSGFVQSVVAALKIKPGEGTRQTLLPLLTDAWHGGLKGEIDKRLRQMLNKSNTQQEAERLLKQAMALHSGSGGEVDLTKAIALYKEAIQLGNIPAAYQLGTMYQSGQGLEVNMTKAEELYIKAAEKGLIVAQMKLAEMYMLGLDVKGDMKASLLWYRIAELGGAEGARGMANMISRRLTPDEIKEVMEKLQKIFPKQFNTQPLK